MGWDAAGIVGAVGLNVKAFHVGDDVFFRPEMEKQGTYADEIVVSANLVAPMPRGLTYTEAASLPLVGLTVWQALVEVGNVQAGDNVLILAGSGGVGSFAIQVAKALGAYMTTTTIVKNIFTQYITTCLITISFHTKKVVPHGAIFFVKYHVCYFTIWCHLPNYVCLNDTFFMIRKVATILVCI